MHKFHRPPPESKKKLTKVYKFYKELHQIKHKKSRETCGEEREKQRGGMEEEGWVQVKHRKHDKQHFVSFYFTNFLETIRKEQPVYYFGE